MRLPDGNISTAHLNVPYNGLIRQHDSMLGWRLEITVRCLYCRSRKLISHIITPLTVRSDDVSHRLLETARPFQAQVAVPIATQDYPSPVTGACASDDNNENSL